MNAIHPCSRFALLLPAAILMAAPQAPPAPQGPFEDDPYQGEAPDRYAMVRALEGEVHVRKGDLDEQLSRGTPIAEGDVVESRGRGVLQLGDGTRVAFGGATRFTVAALFTDEQGGKQVLLRLDYGRLRVLLGAQSGIRFRVDTPSGIATGYDQGTFTLEADRDRLVRLRVLSGRVAFANERGEARIGAGERLTVYSPQDGLDRVRSFNTFNGDDFDRWSDRAVQVQRGESWDHVPGELRYYADELDGHGRWIHSDGFGDVWQPAGVAEDWRPYYQGRWAPYAGGMTWVSDEPWAFVAYHHGRWHWGADVGWFWIPGVNYSPAWVAWNNTPGYCGWAPLGYYNTPCHWGYGAWGGGYAWNVVSINFINAPNIHTRIYSDVRIIGAFNGPGGGRDVHAPWQRSPLIVSSVEFRNPAQLQVAFRPEVHRERMVAYERQAQASTGRVVLHRDLAPPAGGRPPAGEPVRVPFENRGRVLPSGQATLPRERAMEPGPRSGERRPDLTARGGGLEPRPVAPGRPLDPTPRERPLEPRLRPAEVQRPEPAAQRGPEPGPRLNREDRHPDPPRALEREARPAPAKPEAAREKPHEDKRKEEKRN